MARWNREIYERNRGKSFIRDTRRTILGLMARFVSPVSLRIILYRQMGITIGHSVFIGLECFIDQVFPELIVIEDDAVISFRVIIVAHDDAVGEVATVRVVRSAYIGAGAIILPGVVVGEGSVVGAGAVVTEDVSPYTKVAGVPAREIGSK